MAAFVVEASVAVAWVHPSQADAESEAMLAAVAAGATLEVPALWPLEVSNALTSLARRRKLTSEECMAGLHWLEGLRLHIDHEASRLAFGRLAQLAVAYQLSVYDATYLELAERKRLPLGTRDAGVLRAMRRCGVAAWTSR